MNHIRFIGLKNFPDWLLGAKFLLLALHIRHSDVTEICLENIVEAIPFDSEGRCKSHVAPLSEDIDLK